MAFYFHVDEVPPQEDKYQLLENGVYEFVISECKDKENKNKTGHFLSFKLDVVEGRHVGRCVFDSINYKHENQQAEEIGKRKLSQIVKALNKEFVESTAEFIGKRISAEVSRKTSDVYGEQNFIKKYLPPGLDFVQGTEKKQEGRFWSE